MHDTLADELQPAIVRWTMGGAAAPVAPEAIRDRLGKDADEAELRLLVIAGQALATMVVPEPSGSLQGIADLPTLPLPTMPDSLRPYAARVLATRDQWLRDGVLRLIAARGYVVHPSDWMPSVSGEVPDIYSPWQDWARGIQGSRKSGQPEWDDLGPAGRIALVKQLRRDDPSAGLALVSGHLSGEPPERRLAMTNALSYGLSEGDRAFLEGLLGDRAPSVRTAAQRLLARLGGVASSEPMEDIGDLVRVDTSGLLGRRRILKLSERLNHPQRERLARVMESIDARTFAASFGIDDVDLPRMWPWGNDIALDRLVSTMLVETGSDQVVAAFGRAISDGAPIGTYVVGKGASRLEKQAREELVRKSYASERILTVAANATELGIVTNADSSTEWRSIHLQILRGQDLTPSMASSEMLALGLLLAPAAARDVLDGLTRAAVSAADPRLDTLRLSAAL